MSKAKADYRLKFILIGNSGVGKTSIVQQFIGDKTTENHLPTVGFSDVTRSFLKLGNSEKTVELIIHDTAGQEKYWSLTSNFLREANGVLLVYDITSRSSYENLDKWRKLYDDENDGLNQKIFTILIGNKKDCIKKRVISFEEGESYANNNQMIFMETSAKNGDQIQEAFHAITEGVCRLIDDNEIVNTLNIDTSLTFNATVSMGDNDLGKSRKKTCKC